MPNYDPTTGYTAAFIAGYLAAKADEYVEETDGEDDEELGFYVLQHQGGPCFCLVGPFTDEDAASAWADWNGHAVNEWQVVIVDPLYPHVMTPQEAEEFLGTEEG